MPEFDPNHAPEGYIAIQVNPCKHCDLFVDDDNFCPHPCTPHERPDECGAYFKKITDPETLTHFQQVNP